MFLGKKKICSWKKKLLVWKFFFEIWSEVWKVVFQFMLILDLLGMYFDAAVGFVKKSSLLFRLALAILCILWWKYEHTNFLHQIFFNSDSVHKVKKGKRESNNIDDVFTLQVFLSLFTYFLNPEPKNMHHFFQNQRQIDAILLKGISD